MATEKNSAQARVPAPDSLSEALAPAGYLVELLITRSGEMGIENDPDATPPAIDAPIDQTEIDGPIKVLVAGYESEHNGDE